MASCSTVARITTNDSQISNLSKTKASQIEIYSTKIAGKNCELIFGKSEFKALKGRQPNPKHIVHQIRYYIYLKNP